MVLYVSKRPILDTSLDFECLTMRLRATDTNEWEKESHLMEYSRGGQDQSPVPGGKNDRRLMCYVDTPFAMQSNMLSYTGGEPTMGKGYSMVALAKPKLNKKSLTESESIGVNNMMLLGFMQCWVLQFECGTDLVIADWP